MPTPTQLHIGVAASGVPSTLLGKLRTIGGLTFFKDYASNQASADADFSVGLPTVTITASRSNTNPAALYDATGLHTETTVSNTPRFLPGFWTANGWLARPGLAVERSVTNRITYSTAFTNAAWTATGMTVTDGVAAPADALRPTTTCSTLAATAANATIKFSHTDGTAGVYYASVFIRRKTGTGTISLRANAGNSYTDITASVLTTGWTRVHVLSTSLTNPSFDLQISNAGDEVYVYQADLVKSGCVSTPIKTAGSSKARNGETIAYANVGNRTAGPESIFVRATSFGDFAGNGTSRTIIDSDNDRRQITKLNTSSGIRAIPNQTQNSTVAAAAVGYVPSAAEQVVYHAVFRHNYPYVVVGSNGDTHGEWNSGDWTDLAMGTSWYLGSTANQFDGIYEIVAFYNKALEKSDCNTVSNMLAPAVAPKKRYTYGLTPYVNSQTIVGGTTGVVYNNTDYQWHSRLVKVGPDTILNYTSNGFDRDYDATTNGPLGELFVSTFTISTNSFGPKTKVYTSPTYMLHEHVVLLLEDRIRVYMRRTLRSERPNYVYRDVAFIESTDGFVGQSFTEPVICSGMSTLTVFSKPFYGAADKSIMYICSGRGRMWRSTDGGITFTSVASVPRGTYNTSECQYLNIDNTGRIIGVIRDNDGVGSLLMQKSSDWGQTWLSEPIQTGIGAANGIKVTPKIIFAPGHPGRVLVMTNDRGNTNRLTLATATIEDAWNNIWSPSYTPMTTVNTQGNGDICVIDDVKRTYLCVEHKNIGSAEFPTSSDDYYIVRRDVWDWTAV